jgi:hypothetical protein
MYLNSIDTYLDKNPKCQMDKTKFQLVLDVMHLGNVLHTATENAIPNHKANGNRNSKKRVRAPWNEEIGQASRRTKQAFHRWKMDGSPKEPRNALYKEMKESKKTLRQKLRQSAARIRENKYNDIIESGNKQCSKDVFIKLSSTFLSFSPPYAIHSAVTPYMSLDLPLISLSTTLSSSSFDTVS